MFSFSYFNMKIKIQQFLFGKQHSWAITGQNLGKALITLGHDVDFISTDGFDEKYCPNDLLPYVKNKPGDNYDCQISYTAPHNWANYFNHGLKNRFAIFNYEYINKYPQRTLLPGMGKYHNNVDLVLPSSEFSKEVFLNMGIPENKMQVVSHGYNPEDYSTSKVWPVNSKKSKKILLNISQPHKRKALHLALEAYGRAFNKEDDVCLVVKINTSNHGNKKFDVDFFKMLKTFKQKFPKHAEIEVITKYIPNIHELYNACNINFSTAHAECFHYPSLEAICSGLINIAPRYGGLLDFCNDNNSLLIDVDIVRAPKDHLYWEVSPYAVHCQIKMDDAVVKLKRAVNETDSLLNKFKHSSEKVKTSLIWENIAKQIIGLCV